MQLYGKEPFKVSHQLITGLRHCGRDVFSLSRD